MKKFLDSEEILCFGLHDKRFAILKVLYSEKFPVINIEELLALNEGYDRNKLQWRCVAGTKFKDWAHEDEFRVTTNINSKQSGLISLATYIPFLKFSGIITGNKISTQNEILVSELFEKHRFNYYQTNLSIDKYEIFINRYQNL
ncbi:MAG: hypothetical protein CK424_02895 [Legionella sp.]|nr:MAG: hypothetical protein CK424_02895 [Legionella sp.]